MPLDDANTRAVLVEAAKEAILDRIYADWKRHRATTGHHEKVQISRTLLQMELDKEQGIAVSVSDEAITNLIHNGYLKLVGTSHVGLDHAGVAYCERRDRERA